MDIKYAVITGSAIGIGRELVESYCKNGTQVFGIDREPQQDFPNLIAIECDIGDPSAVGSKCKEIESEVEHIDLLVNNAGLWNDTSLRGGSYATQIAAFQDAMGSNLNGSYYATLALLPLLEKSSAANVINMNTEHIFPGHYITGLPATGYDCGKFSLGRLTESWAVELRKTSIRVNGLCFGATDTPMLRAVAPDKADAAMKCADMVIAVENIIAQGAGGDTGKNYLFGLSQNSRAQSLAEIDQLKTPGSNIPTL